jgi:hypothetical protein
MEILWWLAPPAVATVLAMLWTSWLGRAGRGEVDREVAVRRLGDAMAKPAKVARPQTPTRRAAPGERSSGVAVRAPRPSSDRPRDRPVESSGNSTGDGHTEGGSTRRAS